MIKLYKVCTKSVYEDSKDGRTKSKWYQAGILRVTEAGHMFLRMHHQPDIQFALFEQELPQQGEALKNNAGEDRSEVE